MGEVLMYYPMHPRLYTTLLKDLANDKEAATYRNHGRGVQLIPRYQ
jgi:hypothetical protein